VRFCLRAVAVTRALVWSADHEALVLTALHAIKAGEVSGAALQN
jgi:hypothetical protein